MSSRSDRSPARPFIPPAPASSWDLIVVNLTTSLDSTAIQPTILAIQKQVAQDFHPVWNVVLGSISLDDSPEMAELKQLYPGGPRDQNAISLAKRFVDWYRRNHAAGVDWRRTGIVYLTDPQRDFGGVHLDLKEQGRVEFDIPYALVGVTSLRHWSLTFSHEVLELLADPFGSRFAVRDPPLVKPTRGSEQWIVEVCDPSEDANYGYTIDGILVSDFLYPAYFDPTNHTGPFSHTNKITRPFEILRGGYLSFVHTNDTVDESDDVWYQVSWLGGGAQPSIRHLNMSNSADLSISHRLRKYYRSRMNQKRVQGSSRLHSSAPLEARATLFPIDLFDQWIFQPIRDGIGHVFGIDDAMKSASGILNLFNNLLSGQLPGHALPLLGLEPTDLDILNDFSDSPLKQFTNPEPSITAIIQMTLFSMLSYCQPGDRPIMALIPNVLPTQPTLISSGWAQVMLFDFPQYCVVAFRGTEWPYLPLTPSSFNQFIFDWKRNFTGALIPHPIGGRVHLGFYNAVQDLLDDGLRESIKSRSSNSRIILTGHSQGAALAILAAISFQIEGIDVLSTHAIAAPVVGDSDFVNACDSLNIQIFRYYNNLDPIMFARLEPEYSYGPGVGRQLRRDDTVNIVRPNQPAESAIETFAQIAADSAACGYWTIFDHFPIGPAFEILGLWNLPVRPGYLETLQRMVF